MKKRKKAGEKVLNKIDLPTGLAPNAVMESNLNILFLHCENSLANHVLKIKIQKNVLFRACLHGGGGPQIDEVTCGGSPQLSCKRDQIKVSVKENEVPTEKNSSRLSIFATKASYISN